MCPHQHPTPGNTPIILPHEYPGNLEKEGPLGGSLSIGFIAGHPERWRFFSRTHHLSKIVHQVDIMDSPKDNHSSDLVVEDAKVADNVSRAMPATLAALSAEEYEKLGKKATYKLDLVIMPILVVMYILNYLDRQNIASAKLAGIEQDLGLSQVQYQTTVSILFVGYSESLLSIFMQTPLTVLKFSCRSPRT